MEQEIAALGHLLEMLLTCMIASGTILAGATAAAFSERVKEICDQDAGEKFYDRSVTMFVLILFFSICLLSSLAIMDFAQAYFGSIALFEGEYDTVEATAQAQQNTNDAIVSGLYKLAGAYIVAFLGMVLYLISGTRSAEAKSDE